MSYISYLYITLAHYMIWIHMCIHPHSKKHKIIFLSKMNLKKKKIQWLSINFTFYRAYKWYQEEYKAINSYIWSMSLFKNMHKFFVYFNTKVSDAMWLYSISNHIHIVCNYNSTEILKTTNYSLSKLCFL